MAIGHRVFTEYSTHGTLEWELPSATCEAGYPLRIRQVWRGSLCPLRTDEKFDAVEVTTSPLSRKDLRPRPGS